jgi:hypothetical protein
VAWAALAAVGACVGGEAGPPGGVADDDVNETSSPGAWRTVSPDEAARVQTRLFATLTALAGFGEKRAGTLAGQAAGDYVQQRFVGAGLTDVAFEPFTFDGFELHSAALSFTSAAAGGPETPMTAPAYKVFAYSGVGDLAGVEVVDVDEGRPANYVTSVVGKVVLVKNVQTFHRTSQLEIATQKGAAAMLLASAAPANLAQSGGVRLPELGLAAMPAFSIGAVDAQNLRAAIAGGQTVRATLSVDATLERREGRNVIGWHRRPNSQPGDPYLLFGAHYDTWATGATDNGTGVATMLEIAESIGNGTRDYDVAFVGYDAEELGLLGGYDFMRKHLISDAETVSAFLHVDMTGIGKPEFMGGALPRFFAFSGGGPFGGIVDEVGVSSLYQNVLGMEVVPAITGGLIPTDVQGLYWGGLDGAIALSYTPFYHTVADTPDTVDLDFLTSNTLAIKAFFDRLDEEPPASFEPKDPGLLYANVSASSTGLAGLTATVKVTDAAGQPIVRPWVQLRLYVDDFTVPLGVETPAEFGPLQEVIGNDLGEVTFVVAPEVAQAGTGARWLHVRVGKEMERFPRGEHVTALP